MQTTRKLHFIKDWQLCTNRADSTTQVPVTEGVGDRHSTNQQCRKKPRHSHEKQLRLQETRMKTLSAGYDYSKSHKSLLPNEPTSQGISESLKHRTDVNICTAEMIKVFD